MTGFVPFDQVWPGVQEAIQRVNPQAAGLSELWVVRDLMGRVRLLVPAEVENRPGLKPALGVLAAEFHRTLGAHAWEPEEVMLPVEGQELEALRPEARQEEVRGVTVYMVDRQVTGAEWATVSPAGPGPEPVRLTLFSIKGGVGRSTTAAVLASHLARRGRRVLVMDLDLESPGLGSILLAPEEHPDFGVVDWFVEDLVGQGDEVVQRMIGRPSWAQGLPGEILVAPPHGQEPGEYLAKLGRIHLDRPPDALGQEPERWTRRLQRLLRELEAQQQPDVVLLDSRSGLHDLAAAAVTDLDAHTLLFAVDSPATWTGYRLLFAHWQAYRAAPAIRQRLSMVAALVPETQPHLYLQRFRERAWDLFREYLYDEVPADPAEETEAEPYSFDLGDEDAPHAPLPVYWNRGLVALSSLRDADDSVVATAYRFLFAGIDRLLARWGEDGA